MITCLECGFVTGRLQWTHFKYKCTGRFNNSKEYRAVYPTADIVSPEVSAKTSVTKNKLIEKYGEEEGLLRWNQYREKQATSNSFEYKQQKHGWNKEQFDSYNKSRAITLKGMIEKYGELDGISRWESYCNQQAYSNTLEYFVEKHGRTDGIKRFLTYNKQKGSSNDPVAVSKRMGISVDEAVDLIITRYNKDDKRWSSELEREFTTMLEEKHGKLERTSFSSPFGKWSHYLNGYVIYDIKHDDCIIEFNGDYWHANPSLYQDEAVIRGKKAKDIQKRDELKLKTVTDLGFRTLVVWESDFRADKEQTIKEVIIWMQNGQQ